jgi:Flp pilus assembly pilin Flp
MLFYSAIMLRVSAFRSCQSGATAIEYAVIAVVISISFIAAVAAIGQDPLPSFATLRDAFD